MSILTKICGIRALESARLAADQGADYLGFIHFDKSPRHISLESMAELMRAIRAGGAAAKLVSVVVDPDDAMLEMLKDVVKPDLVQLHGKETPSRVRAIAAHLGVPVIKALSISEQADLDAAAPFESVADYLLFDAKPPKDAALPGGLGLRFDWTLMRGYHGVQPWFLAGGLTPDNVVEAIRISGATRVDVSSGVESAPGVKDAGRISGFLKAVKAL